MRTAGRASIILRLVNGDTGDASAATPADSWTTLREEVRAAIRTQRSEFIGIAFPCASEETFQRQLAAIQREHFDATHHCWAWRLFAGAAPVARSSDAGEPSGSAGRPILGAIESADLYDVAVIVVRYYGGVKLGTGGLGRAYRDAAREALSTGDRLEQYLYERVTAEVPFSQISVPYRLLDPPHVTIESEEYGERNLFTFRVRRSRRDALEQELVRQRFEIVR